MTNEEFSIRLVRGPDFYNLDFEQFNNNSLKAAGCGLNKRVLSKSRLVGQSQFCLLITHLNYIMIR